tara:strand:+ start:2268 stop:2528 length:261 start_codon:yes stop_codon:yes gene_type:complete
MIDTDKYEETDHPELVEFEGETLGDTLTNLLTEVKRLREENTTQGQLLSRLVGYIADAKRSIEYTVDAQLNVSLKHTLDRIKEMIE